jgi:formylglycine-generating enzyme required for sulfatase activity/tRNA A-37 threonylcarbamoyl transferase component Bud32
MARPNDKIGPYTLVSKLGQGAFGVVWLAKKQSAIATTQFALKLPRGEDIDVEAFRQEATIWLQASGHPNVLPLIDADIYDGQVVIVSEYVNDGSLAGWLKQHGGKASSIATACEILEGVLAGLAHLHERRIIHRDLKPENILLQRDNPRVADFGISRLLRTTSQSTNVSGTLAYMAPEAFDGKRNERTDIWAVGVIFYQLLGGRLPYDQEDMVSFIGAIMRHDPAPLPESVPEVLRQVVMKALQREPSQRYQSAIEMRQELREAERMLWLQEREAREAPPTLTPTLVNEPPATLVVPDLQETIMPHTPATEVEHEKENAARIVAPTILAAPTPPQPGPIPLGTIKAPPPEPFTPKETQTEKAASPTGRKLWIAAAWVAGLVVIAALMAYGLWTSVPENADQKAVGASQSQPAASVKNGIGMELVLVPAGSFKMGSTNGQEIEKPVHDVTISQPFYMAKYEVTQAQWKAVMGSNPSSFKGDNLPVEQVSWDDANAFIARLNAQKDGYSYRLPTEAEWEYACRAGTAGDYAGDLDAMAWYGNNSGRARLDAAEIYRTDSANYFKRITENGGQTHAVGSKLPNAFGLFDMHGNVWEWCQDWYHETYYGAPSDGSAWLSGGEQKYRVRRGGSWHGSASDARSAFRFGNTPGNRFNLLGFRVVAVR